MIATGKRSNRRRAEIVDATLRVIGRSGADAVTHRAVATEAGVSLASTTYYFDSKDALVHEALELVIDRSTAVVAEHAHVTGPIPPDELVERLVRLTQAQLDDIDAPLIAQFELVIEAARRPALRPLAERWETAYMESLIALVEASGIDEPRHVCEILATLLEGSLLAQISLPRADFVEAQLRPMLQRVVTALSD
jgi:DNA-binding transcriptional regulator YbjK